LDEKELLKYELGLKRVSNTDNKELEEALTAWQLRYNKHSDSGLITEDLLILKAREFWDKLLCYTKKEPLKFSNRWLARFKSRYSIKERQRYREGAFA
jgi:hypothetical protein